MPTPATEIVYITLKPGVDLESSTAEERTWTESVATVAAQDGYQRAYYGRQLEDPSILMLFIDWDSRDAHIKFMESPAYGPFTHKLASIMEGAHFHHINATPFPSWVLGRAPCMEVATFYNAEPTMLQNVERFAKAIDKGQPEGYIGCAYGQVMEEIVRHADVGKDGVEKGYAVMLLIGWQSKDLHLKFREQDLFNENIGLLRQKNGGAEMFHVSFKGS